MEIARNALILINGAVYVSMVSLTVKWWRINRWDESTSSFYPALKSVSDERKLSWHQQMEISLALCKSIFKIIKVEKLQMDCSRSCIFFTWKNAFHLLIISTATLLLKSCNLPALGLFFFRGQKAVSLARQTTNFDFVRGKASTFSPSTNLYNSLFRAFFVSFMNQRNYVNYIDFNQKCSNLNKAQKKCMNYFYPLPSALSLQYNSDDLFLCNFSFHYQNVSLNVEACTFHLTSIVTDGGVFWRHRTIMQGEIFVCTWSRSLLDQSIELSRKFFLHMQVFRQQLVTRLYQI